MTTANTCFCPVSTMASSRVTNIFYCVILYVVVSATGFAECATQCPAHDDVNRAVHHCLRDYTAHFQTIQRSDNHLFAGIDVETLRTLCSHFKIAMQCVTSIQLACPTSRHHSIDVALRPYVAMFDMCYTHKKFIEDYAMSQNCLYSQRDSSDECYNQFLVNTANHQYSASRDRQLAVAAYCRSLTELTSCVRSNVIDRCRTNTAAKLVDILVPLSTELSYKCSVFDFQPSQSVTPVSAVQRRPSPSASASSSAAAAMRSSRHHPTTFGVSLVTCIAIAILRKCICSTSICR